MTNEFSKISFTTCVVRKKILHMDSINMIEMGLWSKVKNVFFYADELVNPEFGYKNIENIFGKIDSEYSSEIETKGFLNKAIVKLSRGKIFNTITNRIIDVDFIADEFYAVVVASTKVTLREKIVEDHMDFIIRNDAPIELIDYLKSNLKAGRQIIIRHKNDEEIKID